MHPVLARRGGRLPGQQRPGAPGLSRRGPAGRSPAGHPDGRRPDDGLTTAEVIAHRYPDLGILLLSTYANDEFVRRFFAHGTAGRGYLLKQRFNDIDDVRHALNLVRRRKTFSDTPILDRLHRRQPAITELLTPRELGVLRLLAAGLSNAAIATQLRIKGDKVEYTTQSIYAKLDIPRTPDQNPRVHAAIRWQQEMPEDGRPGAT